MGMGQAFVLAVLIAAGAAQADRSGESRAQSRPRETARPGSRQSRSKAAVRGAAVPDFERDEVLRNPHRLVFAGIRTYEAADIRQALSEDIDVQVAGDARRPLAEYLKAVEEAVVAGYLYDGFETPQATATLDTKRRRIVVTVDEGPRFRCGAVVIEGLDDKALAKALRNSLTEPWPDLDSVAIENALSDGTSRVVLEDATGHPKKPLARVWRPGKTAEFNDQSQQARDKRIGRFFRAEGRPATEFDSHIETDGESGEAKLIVRIAKLGRKAAVEDISVVGGDAGLREHVEKLLGIDPGSEYSERLRSLWERRLWESGRFVSAQVLPLTFDKDRNRSAPVLHVGVVEHPKAPPLGHPLTPAEDALLKLRSWLYRWSAGNTGEDLVCEVLIDPSKGKAPETFPTIRGRLVIAPRQGEALSLDVTGPNGRPRFAQNVVAAAGEIILHSPPHGVHLRITEPPPISVITSVSGTVMSPTKAAPYGTSLKFDFEWKGRDDDDDDPPFQFQLRIDPAFILASVHDAELDARRQADGTILLDFSFGRLVVDGRSGRLGELRIGSESEGAWFDLHPLKGAFEREVAERRAALAQSRNVYDRQRPLGSALAYLIDESREAGGGLIPAETDETLAALRKLLDRWSPEAIGDLFGASNEKKNDRFILPRKDVTWAEPFRRTMTFAGSGNTAGYLLSLYRQSVPAAGDLWPLGRDVCLAMIGRGPVLPTEAAKTVRFPTAGPIAHLVAAHALHEVAPDYARFLALEGAALVSERGFAADYRPILSRNAWLGRNLFSLLDALAGLDEPELRALSRLISDEPARQAILNVVLAVRRERDRPIDEVLPEVLTRLWRSTLESIVSADLRSLVTETAKTSLHEVKDDAVQPASAEEP